MQYSLITIKSIKSEANGTLSFFESNTDIPFDVKRVYYISGVLNGGHRGAHAHKTLRQFLFCPYGAVEVILNDSKCSESIHLSSPSTGLLLEPGLWRDMLWHEDNSVLCVAASEYYDEKDYIRSFEEYLQYIENTAEDN